MSNADSTSTTTAPDEQPTRPVKSRARRYRERLQEAGYRQVAVWLDGDAYALLQRIMTLQQVDAAAAISKAVWHYHGVISDKLYVASAKTLFTTTVTSHVVSDDSNVSSDAPNVISDVPSDNRNVTRNDPPQPKRYMSSALEDHILALRASGLSLSVVARQLAEEGYLNAKGEPYSTATVSKAETRAKTR